MPINTSTKQKIVVETELNRNLDSFLAQKPLYYNEIDYTRMPRAYEAIKSQLNLPKIIHLVGTNGKGTTGRFLATALKEAGYSVGHYTSPHIVKFNERIWLNGSDIDDQHLEILHTRLLQLLPKEFIETLSYFEYTTFLAILAFEGCEYAVMEAGLGGEYDATSVFASLLTLVTPIGKDHEAFLGESIEQIATTKLKAVKKTAIIAYQNDPKVYEVASKLEHNGVGKFLKLEDVLSDEKLTSYTREIANLNLPHYMQNNLLHAIAALEFLGVDVDIQSFAKAQLFGRLSRIKENVIVDVGHNLLAAQAIKESLMPNKYTLVYNSYKDKDYHSILRLLLPIIEDVEIIEVDDERIVQKELLEQTLQDLGVVFRSFLGVEDGKKYLVFGSFSVVEAFLKGIDG